MPLRQALADQYVLGRLVGRGGTADVYDGTDRRTGRRVAVKVLTAEAARDPVLVSQFAREAEIAATLDHPAIVAVLDSGEKPGPDGTSVRYIVMEHVDGRTLRWILRNGPVPIPTALKITHGVLGALEHAHAAGIVHRDVKPGNVMIATTGQVKVMDFGTAWARGTVEPAQVVGTVQYMSPEHIRGQPVDPRSDLYSVGCLLFQLVTGRPPFVGDDQATVAAQQIADPPPAPSTLNPYLPTALDRIVLTALAKDRADRHQTATQMRTELRALDPPKALAGVDGPRSDEPTPDQAVESDGQAVESDDQAAAPTDLRPRTAPTEEIALVAAGTTPVSGDRPDRQEPAPSRS
ncbi:MAG: protein kinase [Micrococcales bacterium]|nr:protein kinase [Micrococcales bacterium]